MRVGEELHQGDRVEHLGPGHSREPENVDEVEEFVQELARSLYDTANARQ